MEQEQRIVGLESG